MPVGDAAEPASEPHAGGAPRATARSVALFAIAVGVPSFFTGVIGTLVAWAVTRDKTATAATATAAAFSPPVPPTVSGSSFVRLGKPEGATPEGEARRALTRFRDGIGACVRDVIGVLPGTSPPVPNTLKLMKNGVYTSAASDFRTPVYQCAKYAETAPQPFQIQWQLGAPPTGGIGVAWLDDDGDGNPDRAFGFTAKLVKKKEVTLGEIMPLSPVPKVLPVR
jgi:hypothetical protein